MYFTAFLPLALLPVSLAKTISIKVGDSGLDFNPKDVTADKGDVLEFSFYPVDHNVVQSTFDKPCNPIQGGIYSGHQDGEADGSGDVFSVTVNGTDPLWLYCSEGRHCQSGMVMVVNAPKTGDTLQAYTDASRRATTGSDPSGIQGGVYKAAENGSSSSSSSASGSSSASATHSASASSSRSATGTSTASSTRAATSSSASRTSASASSASATSTGAATRNGEKVIGGAGLGALGLLGMLAGGML